MLIRIKNIKGGSKGTVIVGGSGGDEEVIKININSSPSDKAATAESELGTDRA